MTSRKTQPCQKCEGVVYREEKDPLGSIITCTTCGECTYLDHQGRPATPQEREQQPQRSQKPGTADQAARTPEEAEPEIQDTEQPEAQEAQTEAPAEVPEGAGKETTATAQPEDQEENIAEVQEEAIAEDKPEIQMENIAEVPPEAAPAGTYDCSGCGAQLPGPYSRRGEHENCTSCGSLQTLPQEAPSLEWTIGVAMEMHYQGLLPTQIAKAIQRTGQPPVPAWRINHWSQGCMRIAANILLNTRINGGTEWTVLTTPVRDSGQDYNLWNVMDNETGYILETRIASAEEPEPPLLQHIMQQAISRTNTIASRIVTNADPANLDQALRAAVPEGPSPKIARTERELLSGNRLGELTRIMLRRSDEPKGKRTKESLQFYAEGITLDLNLFRTQGGPMDPTPAEAGGLQTKLRTWEDAATVRHRKNSPKPNPPPVENGAGEERAQPARNRKPAADMPEPAAPEPETGSAAIRELEELVREMERERLEFINSYSQLGQDITTTRQTIRVLERRASA